MSKVSSSPPPDAPDVGDELPPKESHEYRCDACGAAEVPDEVWTDLVIGHWLVECAECGVVDLVESADNVHEERRRR